MEPNSHYGKDSTMASLVDTMIRRMGPMNVGKYLAADYNQSQSIERNDFERLTSESKSDGVDFILTKIYGYLEKRYNQDKLKDQLNFNKLEEKELASKRRHDKLLDALRKLKLKVEIKSDNIETQAPSFGLPMFGGAGLRGLFGNSEGRKVSEKEKVKEKVSEKKKTEERKAKGNKVSSPKKVQPPSKAPPPKSKIRLAAEKLRARLKGFQNGTLKLAGKTLNILMVANLLMEIDSAIADRDAGKIDDTAMKRRITSAIASVGGGIAGAELGAFVGTLMGGPLIGGIPGGLAGAWLGSTKGEELGKAIFDTLEDDNPDWEKFLKNLRMQMKYGDEAKEPVKLPPQGDFNPRADKDPYNGGPVVRGNIKPADVTNPNPVKGLGTQTVSGKITPARPAAAPPAPPPTPAPPAPTSRLESVIGTNREMKLSAMTPKDESVVIDNRTQVASPKDNSTPMLSLPPVRNPEKAYRSVIQYNTRVV
jgi:hypothetical protein